MTKIKSNVHSVTAFAPATCANVIVGFDILGLALEQVGDSVTLTAREDNKIVIEAIHSKEELPLEPDKNTASVVVQKLCQDMQLPTGFSITIHKGIPVSSGMGGSAASAIAALVALNAFLKTPLSLQGIAQYGLLGEALASGTAHPDNVVPCLHGGLTLIHSHHPIQMVQLPIPAVYCVVVHPHLQVTTMQARKVLKDQIYLRDYINQSAKVAAFIAALYAKDLDLLKQSLSDDIIEIQRAHFVPGFQRVKAAGLEAGALGVSFSGSGPTMLAIVSDKKIAKKVSVAMLKQLQLKNVKADCWIEAISKKGAHITKKS